MTMKNISSSPFSALITYVQAQCEFSLHNFPENRVMVVAHRGNWRGPGKLGVGHPKAIEAGADMAEIDIAPPKIACLS